MTTFNILKEKAIHIHSFFSKGKFKNLMIINFFMKRISVPAQKNTSYSLLNLIYIL